MLACPCVCSDLALSFFFFFFFVGCQFVSLSRSILHPGASGVGKSSLVLRFVRDEFRDHHEITVGGVCVRMCKRGVER